MNKVRRQPPSEAPVEKPVHKAGDGITRRFIRAVNIFGYFDKNAMVAFMPYLFFLFLMALIYIGNRYYAEKTIRDIDSVQRDLKELRSEFITTKSELMSRSKLTEVAKSISSKGVRESTVAPRKISVVVKED